MVLLYSELVRAKQHIIAQFSFLNLIAYFFVNRNKNKQLLSYSGTTINQEFYNYQVLSTNVTCDLVFFIFPYHTEA